MPLVAARLLAGTKDFSRSLMPKRMLTSCSRGLLLAQGSEITPSG